MLNNIVASQLPTTPPGESAIVLRITVKNESDTTRFVVEGKLVGVSVAELEKCWQAFGPDQTQQTILVDLSGVSFIDASGKQLLARMREEGIRFVATALLPRCLIEEIENSCNKGNEH